MRAEHVKEMVKTGRQGELRERVRRRAKELKRQGRGEHIGEVEDARAEGAHELHDTVKAHPEDSLAVPHHQHSWSSALWREAQSIDERRVDRRRKSQHRILEINVAQVDVLQAG